MADGVIRNFMVALGFKTDNTGLGQMQDAMKGVELKAVALKAALLALASGAVIAVRQTASELDKLYFSSQRIGASATNIIAYGNAISQLGGNAESAIGTLESLAEKMRNSPGYEGMINSLGVNTKQANGDMRDRVDVMKDLSGVLAQMPAYQANAYANSLGIDQNTLLAMRDSKFLSNMEKYQKIQKELGMNDDLTKSGNEFMTEYRDLTMMTKTGFQVIVMQAGKALIPILRLLNELIQAGISAFSQLNPEIKNMLGVALRFTMVALAFAGLIKVFGVLAGFLPTIKNIIWVLKALRLAFLASPIGIILGLAAALALLYDDYKTWRDGGKSLFDWSKWTNGIDTIINKIQDFLDLLDKIKDKVINFVQKIISDPVGAVGEVVEIAKDTLSNLNNGPVSEPVNKINEASKNIVDGAKNLIGKGLNALGGAIVPPANASMVGQGLQQNKAVEVAVNAAKAVDIAVKKTISTNKTGKELNLSEQDIVDIMKVASTEVVGSLKGKNFEQQAAGVIDTILNRTASGKFGGSVRDVVNQPNAFSDINSKQKSAYGSVQKVPLSRVSRRMEEFVRKYLEKRANGQPSSIGENVFYANPNYLSKARASTKKWVKEVEKQAKETGHIFGAGNAIHVHGTPAADKAKMPKPYYVTTPTSASTTNTLNSLPSDPAGLARFAQNAHVPTGNPNKEQVNQRSNTKSSQVTIHQEYKTEMTINGARDPQASAQAVKRSQENANIFLARNAVNPVK